MARMLGHASHTTVQGWCNRNVIPAQHLYSILSHADCLGIKLQPIDLIPDGRGILSDRRKIGKSHARTFALPSHYHPPSVGKSE